MGMRIDCKKATIMISKREEKKLSLFERIQLWLHLLICSLCKLFMKQNKLLVSNLGGLENNITAALSEQEKNKIIETIKSAS